MSDAMAFNNFENLKIPTITTLGKTDNSLFTISQFLQYNWNQIQYVCTYVPFFKRMSIIFRNRHRRIHIAILTSVMWRHRDREEDGGVLYEYYLPNDLGSQYF